MKKQNQQDKKLAFYKTTITRLGIVEKRLISGGSFQDVTTKNSDNDGSNTSMITSGIQCLLDTN